jgi:hypothetical protein
MIKMMRIAKLLMLLVFMVLLASCIGAAPATIDRATLADLPLILP